MNASSRRETAGQTLDRFPKWDALKAHDQGDGILPFAVRAVPAQPAFLLRLDTEAVPVAAAAGDRTRAGSLSSARTGDVFQDRKLRNLS